MFGFRLLSAKGSRTILVIVLALAASPVARAADTDLETLVAQLRAGGYSLYFRHEATDWSQYDDIREAGDWLSCDASRVRQLSMPGANARR